MVDLTFLEVTAYCGDLAPGGIGERERLEPVTAESIVHVRHLGLERPPAPAGPVVDELEHGHPDDDHADEEGRDGRNARLDPRTGGKRKWSPARSAADLSGIVR